MLTICTSIQSQIFFLRPHSFHQIHTQICYIIYRLHNRADGLSGLIRINEAMALKSLTSQELIYKLSRKSHINNTKTMFWPKQTLGNILSKSICIYLYFNFKYYVYLFLEYSRQR